MTTPAPELIMRPETFWQRVLKMRFVTFGSSHLHSIGGRIFDNNCVAVVYGDRTTIIELFGCKWCFEYHPCEFDYESLYHYPRGFIIANPGAKARTLMTRNDPIYSTFVVTIHDKKMIIIVDRFSSDQPCQTVTNGVERVIDNVFNTLNFDADCVVYRDTEYEWAEIVITDNRKFESFKPISDQLTEILNNIPFDNLEYPR